MLWLKAFHLVAVVAWFAGLLYLPRLFVYHAECEDDAGRRRFGVMESRLYYRIMTPAMALVFLFGASLLSFGHRGGWLAAKLLLVFLLFVFHLYCGRIIRRFAAGDAPHSGRFFRLFNEIPAVLLIAVVLLAVLKPF